MTALRESVLADVSGMTRGVKFGDSGRKTPPWRTGSSTAKKCTSAIDWGFVTTVQQPRDGGGFPNPAGLSDTSDVALSRPGNPQN
jgi:hypothetical protein